MGSKAFNQHNFQQFLEQRQITDFASLDLINQGQVVENFILMIFNINHSYEALQNSYAKQHLIGEVRQKFIQRYVSKKQPDYDGQIVDTCIQSLSQIQQENDYEFAKLIKPHLDNNNQDFLKQIAHYARYKIENSPSALFSYPQDIDYQNLLKTPEQHRQREHHFDLSDKGGSVETALIETQYCIYCHVRDKDSCHQGLRDKKSSQITHNPLGVKLNGCPLNQQISQAHLCISQLKLLAALVIIMRDNPLLALTGHRICNDCMKACIYQKQDPVNIPQIETRLLRDILHLPYGVELYKALVKYNPLNIDENPTHTTNGKNITIVGQGPAGITMAYYMLRYGHNVLALEGLKVEPMRQFPEQISYYEQLCSPLHMRLPTGFGGVCEYGITIRWDKNFLSLIRYILTSYENYNLCGGVRFGSNITPEQALEFSDHIILSMGAGAPRTLNIEGRTAIGVRQASDFLMALQLTNAYHPDSLANLQISLPIVVIGGGLTAIDTATEALAYYPLQIEKFLSRYEALLQHHSESKIRHGWNQSMHNMADTWLEHAKILRQVQARGEETLPYLQQWGGCTVMYRKDWQQAPSYIRNHEEVNKALEEGIILTSNHNPTAFISDDNGYVQQIITNQGNYAASTILIAAGTQPNTTLSEEYPALFHKDTNGYFSSQYWQDDKFSTLGDLHPEYSGSVVKAIASAKYGAKSLHTNLQRSNTSVSKAPPQQHELEAEIITINELVDNVYEIGVRSPYAAKNFKAGQFFRLQNYFANAPYKRNTLMAMEGIAVGGCRVVDDVIYTVVRNKGGSTALIPYLKSGEKVIFMGPLGQPIASHTTGKKYLLVGNIAKSTILCAVAKALYLDNEVHHLRSFAEGKPYYQRLYLEYSTRADLFIDEKLLWQQLQSLDLSYYDYIITVGDNRLIRGVSDIAPNKTIVLAGMNSPMQCMMKKICSQCLQEVVCKKTGEKKLEYSCFKQIQDARMVNFQALNNRMRQNEVQESIMRQWLAL